MSRSNNKQAIFGSNSDKLFYYSLLLKLKNENQVDILHYCIMINHVHLMVMPNQQTRLARFMKQVNLSYFCYFKGKNEFCGHLWQGRFKSNIIQTESYLLQCGKYIELNPVRAGIVQRPEDYKFSSYRFYAMGVRDKLITTNPAYLALSDSLYNRKDKYVEFKVNNEIINKDRLRQRFIGNPEFIQSLQEIYKVRPSKPGRPRNRLHSYLS